MEALACAMTSILASIKLHHIRGESLVKVALRRIDGTPELALDVLHLLEGGHERGLVGGKFNKCGGACKAPNQCCLLQVPNEGTHMDR